MLCTNGHNNADAAKFCSVCGVNTFNPGTVGSNPQPTYIVDNRPGWNALAITSLVLGVTWLYWFGSLGALICGIIARKQIKKTGEQGMGLAIAGIVLGAIGTASLVVVILFLAVLATHTVGTGCVGMNCN
jgi:hypothetical protein